MCLSVYLGATSPIELPQSTHDGGLGIEVANWTPPPLRQGYKFIYYLGQKGDAPELGCSCMLQEYVNWTESGARIESDDLYPDRPPCPFDVLRGFCEIATVGGGAASIVCDDSGGLEQKCESDDYGLPILLPIDLIRRGNLLFADVTGNPWRVWHVINPNLGCQKSTNPSTAH